MIQTLSPKFQLIIFAFCSIVAFKNAFLFFFLK